MLTHAIELIGFKRVTRDILKGTSNTSLNDSLDCINYMKRNNLDSNYKALRHLYNK